MSQRRTHVSFVIIIALIAGSVNSIQQFGSPAFSKSQPRPSFSSWNLILLPSPVTQEGNLFAFSASIAAKTTAPFIFQVYRPQPSNDNFYTLIYSLPVNPSVLGQQEIFYVESLFTSQRCFHVLPGDILGIYSATSPLGLSLFFDAEAAKSALSYYPDAGLVGTTTVPTTNFYQPYFVEAFGYYENATGSSCTKGLNLINFLGLNLTQPISSTTYLPPVGVQGQPGPIGLRGNTGRTGLPGLTGLVGASGASSIANGIQGVPGPQGDTGPANTVKGIGGVKGPVGSIGLTGPSGLTGATGPMGINGSVGLPGLNSTSPIKDPLKDLLHGEYFITYKSVRGLFIWLAIESFVFLVAIVALVCAYRFHSELKLNHVQKHGESTR